MFTPIKNYEMNVFNNPARFFSLNSCQAKTSKLCQQLIQQVQSLISFLA